MYDNNLEESETSWFGIPDQENVYLQLGFENHPHPTYGIDYLAPADLSTPLSPSGEGTLPLAVDIANGELSTNNPTNDPASARARLNSIYIFQYDELAKDLPALYSSISHDARALQVLDTLICEIIDTSTELVPEENRVDVLVVPYESRFCCPFVDCQKKDTRWAAFRDARDHIWIDHLRRRLPCSWNRCQEIFSRPFERDRHIKEHKGLGEKFICSTCGKEFPKKGNRNRHSNQVHKHKPSTNSSFDVLLIAQGAN